MRTLNQLELRFISEIVDEIVEAKTKGGSYIVEPNKLEELYIRATRPLEGTINVSEFRLKQTQELLSRTTEDLEEFKAWVKDLDEKVYEKAMDETFGKVICSCCHNRTHERYEVDGGDLICEDCYEDSVECERCECRTLDYKTYRGDMTLCSVCYDDMV